MADETSSAAQSIQSTCPPPPPSLNTIASSSSSSNITSTPALQNGIINNENVLHSRKVINPGKQAALATNSTTATTSRGSPSVNMISGHSRSLSHPVKKTTSTASSQSAFLDPPPISLSGTSTGTNLGLSGGQSGAVTAPTSATASTFGSSIGHPLPSTNTNINSSINTNIVIPPFTPTRPSLPRGLSLQLPSQTQPLPPYLDPALGFSTVRRPRLDFTRSCTSLHHSFIADSPDSSPLTPSMPIPRRGLDSPIAMYTGGGGGIGGGVGGAGSIFSSMLADSRVLSDSSSDSSVSDDDEMELSSAHSQFGPSLPSSANMNDMFNSSALLTRRHMTRLRGKGRSRQSSSSASASSTSLASPSPTTPPNGEIKKPASGGYFGSQLSDMIIQRRQSISQAMKKIGFLSGSGASDDGKADGKQLDAVRRPVVRRGNLLPKPKHFQRVKAALIEEAAPVDAEMRIEAAIQRQLREDDEEEDTRTVPQTPVLNAQAEDDNALVFEDTEDEAGGPSFKSAAQRNSGYWGALESSSPGGFMGFRMNPDGDIIMGTDSMVNSPVSRSPEVRKLKRRRDDDEVQFEPPSIIKRRAVSPGFSQSPTVLSSPVAIPANMNQNGGATNGTRSKRSSYILEAHEGLGKMSISPFG
ncbi:hypothetical protein TWF730_009751 [Orbilia blumenaviensis]|uniref:Uncharacterized protein n=1 Tax=Orbilia blumenaviensis TaxID=1796055 RepID=A0AAV9USM6_9PEZI